MAMFGGAHDLVVSDNHFININNNSNGPNGIDVLLEASVPDAAVDAEARQYAPSCFPGTREQYINDIIEWATTDDQVPPIYWMRGPAGVGKSAIAQTCAKKLEDTGHLGATFFFSVNGRSDHRRFFTTLAYQLSTVLPDYRQVLDNAIQNDKTLVTKAISSQFDRLIAKPMRELATQGKDVRRRAIFIDGLDECSRTDAQSEIIKIIATSARDKTTPFRWAIFSRAEAHITSTFARNDISPHISSILLPISRDCDWEVEIYLRNGFENMLRRRNLPLEPSWPTNEVIERLVDASAGLFAYPATVLRFIDHHSYSGFEERLEAVLNTIIQFNVQQRHSPFAELDAFYILIMKRISEDLLPSVLLFLGAMIQFGGFDGESWGIALLCNSLGLSDIDSRNASNALQAVLAFQGPPEPPILDQNLDLARSYFDQDQLVDPSSLLITDWLAEVHGTVNFYHKSFYDFLVDPTRSFTFCVTTPVIREKLFDCYVNLHSHYAQSYVIRDNRLVLAPGVLSSAVSLSKPHGSEFVDSFLKLKALGKISWLVADFGVLAPLKDVPQNQLQKLAELDYRKSLVCEISVDGHGLFTNSWAIDRQVWQVRLIAGTKYQHVTPANFSALDLVAFLRMLKKLRKLEVIRPYHRHLPSTFASAYHSLSQQLKPSEKSHGLYRLGRGEKSVIWYWEFDTEKRYFLEFRTLDFSKTKEIFETEKFKMWEDDWEIPS